MRACLVSFAQEKFTKEVLANYASIAKLSAHLTPLGIKYLVNEVFLAIVTNYLKFWSFMVKLEHEEPIDPEDYVARMQGGEKLQRIGSLRQEFN